MNCDFNYHITQRRDPITIDGSWNKPVWQKAKPIGITNFMGSKPGFFPVVQAKMMYDDDNLYVIFNVQDRYVRCITTEYNGPVWQDSCVEFFFSPDIRQPGKYFNLEINCAGIPLMHYNTVPRKEAIHLEINDLKKIDIAGSLHGIIDPETKGPVTWTLEYKMPLAILAKYAPITRPAKGVQWKANFYKIAENNSNPHYLTWTVLKNEIPDFHLPAFFGCLTFE